MDALSEVLSAIRLDGAVYVSAEFTAPWCVATQYGLHTAAPKLPDSDHVVFFHLLTDGSCLARLEGGSEVIEVTAGDLLLLPHDDLHVLGSDLDLPFAEVRNSPPESGGLLELRAGGGGEATRIHLRLPRLRPPRIARVAGQLAADAAYTARRRLT